MNLKLTKAIDLEKDLEAFKALPSNKARGPDGFPFEVFVKLWDSLGADLLEVFTKALHQGWH
jgi:hypothetical protein